MEASTMWEIIIAIVIVALLGVMIVLYKKKKIKRKTNYKALLALGVALSALGIIFNNSVFYVLGPVYIIMGLANKIKLSKKTKKRPKK